MKLVRLTVSLVFLAAILCVGIIPRTNAQEEGRKCQCYMPNLQKYGIYCENGCCEQSDCWVTVPPLQ